MIVRALVWISLRHGELWLVGSNKAVSFNILVFSNEEFCRKVFHKNLLFDVVKLLKTRHEATVSQNDIFSGARASFCAKFLFISLKIRTKTPGKTPRKTPRRPPANKLKDPVEVNNTNSWKMVFFLLLFVQMFNILKF